MRALAVIFLGLTSIPSVASVADQFETLDTCLSERARYYGENSCDPAPALTGAVRGSCAKAEAETIKQWKKSYFVDMPTDKMRQVIESHGTKAIPMIEMVIVNTRIEMGLCR